MQIFSKGKQRNKYPKYSQGMNINPGDAGIQQKMNQTSVILSKDLKDMTNVP